MYKIMIVEGEINIRMKLKMILENALYETILVSDFNNVVGQIIDCSPDVVLLDVNLPKESGLKICADLRKSSDVAVIFVTSNNSSMDELNCITLGGDDYIYKPYNAPILLARLSSLLKRIKKSTDNSENLFIHRDVTLSVLSATVSYDNKDVELSKTELKILYYLFNNIGKFISRVELVEYLWDNQLFIDDNTLSINITRIRNKLQAIGVNDFIETKRGLGYKI